MQLACLPIAPMRKQWFPLSKKTLGALQEVLMLWVARLLGLVVAERARLLTLLIVWRKKGLLRPKREEMGAERSQRGP